jgi:Ras-related protein Rab-1A
MVSSYYKGAHGVMIVYDVCDRDSFQAVNSLIAEINRLTLPSITKLLIGNKSDLVDDREVSSEEGKRLAKKYGLKFLESSAKKSLNVFDAFKLMAAEMVKMKKGIDTEKEVTTHKSNTKSKGKGIRLEPKTNDKSKSFFF